MLKKIKPCLFIKEIISYVAELITKWLLWTWSIWPADQNMSVSMPVGTRTKAIFRTTSRKNYHFCYYIVLHRW